MRSVQVLLFGLAFLSFAVGSPQFGGSGRWNTGGSNDFPVQNQYDDDSSSSGADNSPSSSSSSIQRRNILIAHAVLGTIAWAFLFPVGAIFLRLNINHPIMLKLHVLTQISAYFVYVAATGLGIWLALRSQNYYAVWSDPHPLIGLLLFVFATLQPFSGWIHHRIYHARAVVIATTKRGPRPGRTTYGYIHLWFGRALITLGIVNGGLGLKIMEDSPVQDAGVTRNAQIGYGIGAGLMWCIYIAFTTVSETARSIRKHNQALDVSPRRNRGEKVSSLSSSSSSGHHHHHRSLRQLSPPRTA